MSLSSNEATINKCLRSTLSSARTKSAACLAHTASGGVATGSLQKRPRSGSSVRISTFIQVKANRPTLAERSLAFRIHLDGSENNGRIVFRIKATLGYKGVVAGREGWGNEKKLVW